jgi:hypothetical protein
VSFWLPGQYASLTAVPGTPGWSIAAIYYHASLSSAADVEFPQGAEIQAGLGAQADFGVFAPAYTFPGEVLGGQATISLAGIYGRSFASVDATLTGPNGGRLSGHADDTRWGFGDLYPTASLKWNMGVNNVMAYVSGDIPVGAYDEDRLANIGIGHAAIDGGFGYTFFNPESGNEFSFLAGVTYNFENERTDYQNGIDAHLDWGASKFLSERLQVGLAGYFYQQLTGDSGKGATLGAFESSVAAIGPQFGYFFPAGQWQGYFNARGYYEFAAENRPKGWNAFLTLAFSPMPGGQ